MSKDKKTEVEATEPEVVEPVVETSEDPQTPEEETQELAPAQTSELAESDEVSIDEDEDGDSEDSLTFSNGVIEKIVAIAVREVPGVLGMKGGFVNRIQETFGATVATKGVTVEIAPDNTMRVNISVIIEYGAYAPQVFEDVKKVVVEQVSGMTGLEVGGVNLRIEDVLTQDEYKNMQHAEDAEAESE